MKTVTARQMKSLDNMAIKRFCIPALILMENAGRTASEEALKMLPRNGLRKVAILCGYGNNGGDGFVCARHLINKGIQVSIYLIGGKKKFSEESKINYQILSKMRQKIKLIRAIDIPELSATTPSADNLRAFCASIKKYHLIIDAIFGIGLKGELNVFYQTLFDIINTSRIPILALDIPSGLDADTGKPLGNAIMVTKTVTFGLLKKGLVKKHARKFTGKVVVGDISLPQSI